MEQEKEYRINNSTIKIIFGNILDSKAEVIVNSSGSKMTMGGGLTRAIREAGGSNIQVLFSWVGRYLSENRLVSLQENNDDTMANKSKDEQIRELKAELKKARKEAELEKLRAHAYDTMINLAEERFNIPIRKKSGTKQ